MNEKRRDSKNHILRNGESQRKDGRYAYVYVDGNGKQHFLYSWKLENTDKNTTRKERLYISKG
nr:integrase DNA-binding domain-containing protein [Anaerosporobacter sp.]